MQDIPLKNRDINWLSFNYRVLQEAKDPNNPLYEQLKFLAIFSSNLDEFFKVRVSQLRQIKKIDKSERKKLALKPNRTLREILRTVKNQQEEFGYLFFEKLIPDLKLQGVELITYEQISKIEFNKLSFIFNEKIAHLLRAEVIRITDNKKSFLENEVLYLFVDFGEENCYALVNIPSELPRFIIIENEIKNYRILFIDDIIKFFVQDLFENRTCKNSYEIKLSRDAELYIDDEFEGILKEKILESLPKRQSGQATRLLYDQNLSKTQLKFLKGYFNLGKVDLMPGGKYHNFKDFFNFPDPTENQLLHHEIFEPIPHKILSNCDDFFSAIKKQDHLTHYPYMSFDIVENFLEQAANDQDVLDIKITLYRVAKSSKLTSSLLKALKKGKNVTIFVEAKARFDEQNNLKWGKRFEKHGANVIYSFPKIKIHSKILCVNRKEINEIISYAYIGTGNFNAKTSKLYCDHGLFTANKKITKELYSIFDVIEGNLTFPKIRELIVSPFNARMSFSSLIQKEIDQAKIGNPAKIIAKMNSLEDEKIIRLLYQASQCGVEIRLLVRGFSCLVPGLKDFSKNITITSILDRYLEHGRIYHFHHGGEQKMYLGSADWMTRNLDKRIEVVTPIKDENLKQEIIEILQIQCQDNVKARIIDKDDTNEYVQKSDTEKTIRSQVALYEYLKQKHAVEFK